MEKISFDSGMRAFKLGDGVLRFNPADPGVYSRFLQCGEKLRIIEEELSQQAKAGKSLELLSEADKKMKAMFSWVFGSCNDFNEILGGVSLLATGENGEKVISNLLSALEPILVEGAKLCARQIAEKCKA